MSQYKWDAILSYCWAQKSEVTKIYEDLTRDGFNVWRDVDQMDGYLDESMAKGVLNSSMFIACISSQYESSDNCKKEYRYANTAKKKPRITIVLQEKFKPTDGSFLDFDFGQTLYYRLYPGPDYAEEYKNFVKALKKACPASVFWLEFWLN